MAQPTHTPPVPPHESVGKGKGTRRIDYYQHPATFQLDPATQPAPYGMREDGTPKGDGFFGKIPRTDDPTYSSTELSGSTDFKINGRTVLFPLLVPTLTREEIDYLVSTSRKPTSSQAQQLEKRIYSKAQDFAKDRIKKGMSPFANKDERVPLPAPITEEQAMQHGFEAAQP